MSPTTIRVLSRLKHWDVIVGVLVVVLFVVGGRLVEGVMTGTTVFFTLQDVGEILLLALPMTLLIIAGEIDLSVGSAIALSSAIIGKAYSMGAPMWLACLIGIGTGAAGGAFNGFLVTVLGLGSLAVTIGTLALYRGLAWVLLGSNPVANFPSSWLQVGYGDFLGWLPLTTPLFVVAIAAFGMVLHWSKTGQAIYAMGTNLEAARFSGIRTTRIKFNLFLVTGAMAGLSSVTYTLKFATATPNAALGVELAVIAAVLFGGVSIFGGVGGLVGSVNAVLFLGLSRAVLRLADVPPNVLTIVTGGLLLASVIGPAVLLRLRERREHRRGPQRPHAAGEPFDPPTPLDPQPAPAPEPELRT
ncbi:MAG TPA: ABC transporter permease [Euzebya sp.]|nr:ABC transporter permease [Euzebya sp.]